MNYYELRDKVYNNIFPCIQGKTVDMLFKMKIPREMIILHEDNWKITWKKFMAFTCLHEQMRRYKLEAK